VALARDSATTKSTRSRARRPDRAPGAPSARRHPASAPRHQRPPHGISNPWRLSASAGSNLSLRRRAPPQQSERPSAAPVGRLTAARTSPVIGRIASPAAIPRMTGSNPRIPPGRHTRQQAAPHSMQASWYRSAVSHGQLRPMVRLHAYRRTARLQEPFHANKSENPDACTSYFPLIRDVAAQDYIGAISPTTRTRVRSELPGKYASGRSSTSMTCKVARSAPASTALSSAARRAVAMASSRLRF
jgi:hypothetical protein